MIARRGVFRILGLATFGLVATPTLLTVSSAEAQGFIAIPAQTPGTGTERRQERHTTRTEQREERRGKWNHNYTRDKALSQRPDSQRSWEGEKCGPDRGGSGGGYDRDRVPFGGKAVLIVPHPTSMSHHISISDIYLIRTVHPASACSTWARLRKP